MDIKLSDYIKVIISEDSMTARVYLANIPGPDGLEHPELFTRDNILSALSNAGVKAGINNAVIDEKKKKDQRNFGIF